MANFGDFITVEWAPSDDPTETSPSWVEITSIVMEARISGGRESSLELFPPRSCVLRCRNGIRTPTEAPTFALGGFYKWRQIRVKTSADNIFSGFIESVIHDQTNAPNAGFVTIVCTDVLGVLSRAEFDDTAGSAVSGYDYAVTYAEAVTAALTQAGLSAVTATADGSSTAYFAFPEPDDVQDHPVGNILQWLQDVCEAEAGAIQATTAPLEVASIGRWAHFGADFATAAMTFSAAPTGGEYEIRTEDLLFAATDDDYFNRAVAKTSLDDTVFAVGASTASVFTESFSRTELPLIHSAWAEADANLWFNLFSESKTYPRSLHLHLATWNSGTVPAVAAAVLDRIHTLGSERVDVKFTPVGGSVQTYQTTVENFDMLITDEYWTCRLGFASHDRWTAAYGNGTTMSTLFALSTSSLGGTHILAP